MVSISLLDKIIYEKVTSVSKYFTFCRMHIGCTFIVAVDNEDNERNLEMQFAGILIVFRLDFHFFSCVKDMTSLRTLGTFYQKNKSIEMNKRV